MSDEPPRYKWPRYVLAAVIVFFVASIIWMAFAVYKEKQERDLNAPIQTH